MRGGEHRSAERTLALVPAPVAAGDERGRAGTIEATRDALLVGLAPHAVLAEIRRQNAHVAVRWVGREAKETECSGRRRCRDHMHQETKRCVDGGAERGDRQQYLVCGAIVAVIVALHVAGIVMRTRRLRRFCGHTRGLSSASIPRMAPAWRTLWPVVAVASVAAVVAEVVADVAEVAAVASPVVGLPPVLTVADSDDPVVSDVVAAELWATTE